MNQNILTEIDAGIGIVTLNRPDSHNVCDMPMLAALRDAIGGMAAEPTVRVVVLSGVGPSFCTGTGSSLDDETASMLAGLLGEIAACPRPVIARVHGAVCGGGLGIVAACDLAVATFDARFSTLDPNAGLVPAAIAPAMRKATCPRHAGRYLLTGETFSAAEAYRIGLIHEMVADMTSLDEAIGEWIDALLAQGSDQRDQRTSYSKLPAS